MMSVLLICIRFLCPFSIVFLIIQTMCNTGYDNTKKRVFSPCYFLRFLLLSILILQGKRDCQQGRHRSSISLCLTTATIPGTRRIKFGSLWPRRTGCGSMNFPILVLLRKPLRPITWPLPCSPMVRRVRMMIPMTSSGGMNPLLPHGSLQEQDADCLRATPCHSRHPQGLVARDCRVHSPICG